ENAVDRGVLVEAPDDLERGGQRRGRWQPLVRNAHPGFLGRLELVADVDRRCGVVADEHDRECGRTAQSLADARDAPLELVANLLSDGLAVEDFGGHGCS